MTAALTKAATKNDYHPEWISMGVGNTDIAALARTFDQDQWKHAFGVGGIYMPVQGLTAGPSDLAFQWYWGPNAGAYSQAVVTDLELLYAGIHMAGPKLTPQTYKDGMFSRPPVGGEAEGQVTSTGRFYGKAAKLPYNEYLTGGDVALVWWDTETVGPSVAVNLPDSAGVWQYMDGGKRYIRGQIPSKVKFFDKSNSINVITTVPRGRRAARLPVRRLPEQRRHRIVTMLARVHVDARHAAPTITGSIGASSRASASPGSAGGPVASGLELTVEAAREAIADAGLTPDDIDGVTTVGETPLTEAIPALGLEPTWTGEGGSAVGGSMAGVHNACRAAASGAARHVLVYRSVAMLGGSVMGSDAPSAAARATAARRRGVGRPHDGRPRRAPRRQRLLGRQLGRHARAAAHAPLRHDARAAGLGRGRTRDGTRR